MWIRCYQWIEWKNNLNRYPCESKCFCLDFFHKFFQLPGWMQTFMFSKQQRQSAKKQNCKLWCVKTEIFGFSVLNTIKSVYHNGGIMGFFCCCFFVFVFCAHQTDWLGLYWEIWHNNNRPLYEKTASANFQCFSPKQVSWTLTEGCQRLMKS